jgi:glutamine synthetase
LRRVVARAKALGYEVAIGSEFEFFVFKETPASLHAKGFRGLEPISPGMFGYSWVREGQNADLCHAIQDDMAAFGIPIEGLHTETGPGVYEVAIEYDRDPIRAADKAALFKTGMKQLAARLGYSVTFMAKYSHSLPGSSGHLHQSLWKDGKNAFYDEQAPGRLSAAVRYYVGGQLALMPEVTALVSPTINSYKRYVPGVWAPLNASWGIENRTCAIRVIPGSAKSTRIEYRQTAADINPYIAMATTLGAGLWGIENAQEPPALVEGDASERSDLAPLPRTLREATDWLHASARAKEILGAEFVDHFVRSRDWECREYERAVTEWELARYFEAV